MSYQNFEGVEIPSFAMSEPLTHSFAPSTAPCESSVEVSTVQDDSTSLCDFRTWNWVEAANEVGVKESTLRLRWWEEKIEPAYRHCSQPLRVVVRRTKAGKEFSEFTTYGIEVFRAYKQSLEVGELAAEQFLSEARAQYPPPPPVDVNSPEPGQATEAPDDGTSNATPINHAILPSVEVGNHQQTLPPPELPQIYTLQSLRVNESIQIDDPLALANQVVQAIDLVQNVMKSDLQNREQKLKDTQKAKRLIDEKVQELKFEQRFYQEKANQIDSTQTETTQTLQEALSVLQALGKPNVETPTDSAS